MPTVRELACWIASRDEVLPGTLALEQRVGIGTGFHGKWYRSQREHWLAWLVVQDTRGMTDCKKVWNRLHCAPMMFWLAEAAGLDAALMDSLEAAIERTAQTVPMDAPQHGSAVRQMLPWERLAEHLRIEALEFDADELPAEAIAAHARLVALRPEFGKKAP